MPRTESHLTYYTVRYTLGDHQVRETTCITEEDYTAPIDFPNMLAVKHFGHQRFANRVRVLEYKERM